MILVSKFMVHRALSDKTYLSLGLLSPLKQQKLKMYTVAKFAGALTFFSSSRSSIILNSSGAF